MNNTSTKKDLTVESCKIKWRGDFDNNSQDYLLHKFTIHQPESFNQMESVKDRYDAIQAFEKLDNTGKLQQGGKLEITKSDVYVCEVFENKKEGLENLGYLEHDAERLSSFNETWFSQYCYIEVVISYQQHNQHIQQRYITIESEGLYGIESDSTEDYKNETARNQYNDLKDHLNALGIDVTLPDFKTLEIDEK